MNKKPVICLQVHNTEASVRFSIEIARHCENLGVRVYLWCNTGSIAELCLEQWPDVIDFSKALQVTESHVPWNDARLVEFMRTAGYHNLNDFFFTQSCFDHNRDQNYWLEETRRNAQAVEYISREGIELDACVTYSGDEFFHNIFKIFSAAQGSRMVYYTETCFPNRVAFTTHRKGIWEVDTTKAIDASADAYTSEYLNILRRDRPVSSVNPVSMYQPSFTLFRQALGVIKSRAKRKRVTKTALSSYIKEQLGMLRRMQRIRRLKDLYVSPSALHGKTYYFMPLHYPLDSQLTLRGRQYIRQENIVEIVARYIPYPDILVVKEHPLARGFMGVAEMKRLRNIDNVLLLDPLVNSHEIIKNARAVIVLNSTVGFEAILYEKRVITLADSFYRGHGLSTDLADPASLESVLCSFDDTPLDQHSVKNFLDQCFSDSYPIGIKDIMHCNVECAGAFAEAMIDDVTRRCNHAATSVS